ncbi:CHC2 zinc finger domain-containing protein [Ottowia sp.]|uniref:CHC2 zinc finger domain-containing protein n=1 Tax=Ottowia sp. TaxID=1898956 RepID=UPI002B67822C|nr:CHC2 zinc finger domain-containing protein [Ottowia sp.]HRN76598.1 hypothetical protein [Ottowia sp.]HRQ03641.1 hypothetical protein [Ottowia sp.]
MHLPHHHACRVLPDLHLARRLRLHRIDPPDCLARVGVGMSFDRNLLPEPIGFYENDGLVLTGRGKWRTTSCVFHGGSDSMRINTTTGAWRCMACDEKGGDVLAYRMAVTGEDFVTAARALDAWVNDGRPALYRPTTLSPRDALALLAQEANLVAVTAANIANGVPVTRSDLDRTLTSAGRINLVVREYAL